MMQLRGRMRVCANILAPLVSCLLGGLIEMSFLNLHLAEAGHTHVAMNERQPSPYNKEPQITELTEEEAKQEERHVL